VPVVVEGYNVSSRTASTAIVLALSVSLLPSHAHTWASSRRFFDDGCYSVFRLAITAIKHTYKHDSGTSAARGLLIKSTTTCGVPCTCKYMQRTASLRLEYNTSHAQSPRGTSGERKVRVYLGHEMRLKCDNGMGRMRDGGGLSGLGNSKKQT
jgi:hypothetical protein